MLKHVSTSEFLEAFEAAEVWYLWEEEHTRSVKLSVKDGDKETVYQSPDLVEMNPINLFVFREAAKEILWRKTNVSSKTAPDGGGEKAT